MKESTPWFRGLTDKEGVHSCDKLDTRQRGKNEQATCSQHAVVDGTILRNHEDEHADSTRGTHITNSKSKRDKNQKWSGLVGTVGTQKLYVVNYFHSRRVLEKPGHQLGSTARFDLQKKRRRN